MSLKLRNLNQPWIWAFLGSILMWLIISIITSHYGFDSLIVNAGLASFLIVISLGQMFAISSGGGGIDLSIPYIITASAFLSIGMSNGSNQNLLWVIIFTIIVGIVVGVVNSLLILAFNIPPIIATMAVGFILNSGILVYSAKFSSFKSSPLLSALTNKNLLGIPLMILLTIVLALVIGFILYRTSYGRSLMAVGQNSRAAFLAGIKVNKTILIAYVLSGVLAAVGGALIGAHVGGAFLDIGQPYLLQSVGAVVIGGTLISGGKSTILGTLFGSLFLTLIVTLMGITKLPIGIQDIIEGLIIIAVLAAARQEK